MALVRRFVLAALLSVLGLAAFPIAACGASSPAAPTPIIAAPVLDAVVFAFADLSGFTTVGATAQTTALGVYRTGPTRDITASCINWQSDDPRVLTVDGSGLLTAQSTRGSATITTTCQGMAALDRITINAPPALPPGISPVPPSSSPGTGLCPTPPYTITRDRDGQRHCRAPNGQFADNVCCGL